MGYFDSPKNRAMWNRELAELRKEKERRAIEGYHPQKKEEKAAKQAEIKETNPNRRRINLAELERIDMQMGKIRRVKRPTRSKPLSMENVGTMEPGGSAAGAARKAGS